MLYAYNDNFTSSLPICIPFISFSCLIAVARTSHTMLKRSGEGGHPCLAPEFRRKAFSFSPLCWLWVCHKRLLLCWDMFPLYSLWWEFLSWMDVEFYQIIFLRLLRWSCGFCLLLMWCITLIDLCMLNHPCDPGTNPTSLWYMIFFMYCWIQVANILLRIFASTFIKDTGL